MAVWPKQIWQDFWETLPFCLHQLKHFWGLGTRQEYLKGVLLRSRTGHAHEIAVYRKTLLKQMRANSSRILIPILYTILKNVACFVFRIWLLPRFFFSSGSFVCSPCRKIQLGLPRYQFLNCCIAVFLNCCIAVKSLVPCYECFLRKWYKSMSGNKAIRKSFLI